MTDNSTKALATIADALKLCFMEGYHQDVLIKPRSEKNLIATWWWARHEYKARRWELSVRFPGDLLKRYGQLDADDRARVSENIRDTVCQRLGELENLDEGQIDKPASYVCELDERMFD